jgi:hypothetical protein
LLEDKTQYKVHVDKPIHQVTQTGMKDKKSLVHIKNLKDKKKKTSQV